jgi:hypothetical protein
MLFYVIFMLFYVISCYFMLYYVYVHNCKLYLNDMCTLASARHAQKSMDFHCNRIVSLAGRNMVNVDGWGWTQSGKKNIP